MTALAYKPKLKGDVEYVGPYRDIWVNAPTLQVIKFDAWLEDTYRPDQPVVLMGRNGRPRNKVTLPGHNKGVTPLNKGRKFPPEPLTDEEALRLLNAIRVKFPAGASDPQGVRDRALIALLWRTGLRISEALDLRVHHVDFQARRVKVMNGKGSKTRTVGIDAYGLHELQPWLFERALLGLPAASPLFCTIQRPGRGNRVNDAYIRAKIHRLAVLAGIPKRVHPHVFRHTLAVSMVRERFTIPQVQAQLGHGNVATTATYLRGLGADEAFDLVAQRPMPGGAL